MVIKSVLITSIKIQRSVGKALKKTLQDAINEDLHKNEYATFLGNLASGKIRMELRKKLAKIYPLKEAAIRSVILAGSGVIVPPLPVERAETSSETLKYAKANDIFAYAVEYMERKYGKK